MYCSVGDVLDYLDQTSVDATRDALIASLIMRVSDDIDRQTNRPLRADTGVAGWATATTVETGRTVVDADGRLLFWVKRWPITAVTHMKYRRRPDSSWVSITPIDHEQRKAIGWAALPRGEFVQVEASYTGGYVASSYPGDLVHAATVLTARAFMARQAAWGDSVGDESLGTIKYVKIAPREISAILARLTPSHLGGR